MKRARVLWVLRCGAVSAVLAGAGAAGLGLYGSARLQMALASVGAFCGW